MFKPSRAFTLLSCSIAIASLAACGGGSDETTSTSTPSSSPTPPSAAIPASPPKANAGAPKWISLGSQINLDGSSSVDVAKSGQLTYSWSLKRTTSSKPPQISSPASVTTPVTFADQGVYEFELLVTDAKGSSSRSTVFVAVALPFTPPSDVKVDGMIKVPSVDPEPLAPSQRIVLERNHVTRSELPNQVFTLLSAPSGSSVDVRSGAFTPDLPGVYVTNLKYTSPNGGVSNAQQWFAVMQGFNTTPVAKATPSAFDVDPGTTIQLDGSESSDPDADVLSYQWSLTRPPHSKAVIANARAARATLTIDTPGPYSVTLLVNDGRNTKRSTSTAGFSLSGNPTHERKTFTPSSAFDSFEYQVAKLDLTSSVDTWIYERLIYQPAFHTTPLRVSSNDQMVMPTGYFDGANILPVVCPQSDLARGCQEGKVTYQRVTSDGRIVGYYQNTTGDFVGFVLPSYGQAPIIRFAIGKLPPGMDGSDSSHLHGLFIGPISILDSHVAYSFGDFPHLGYSPITPPPALRIARATQEPSGFTETTLKLGILPVISDQGSRLVGHVVDQVYAAAVETHGFIADVASGTFPRTYEVLATPPNRKRTSPMAFDPSSSVVVGCSTTSDVEPYSGNRAWIYRDASWSHISDLSSPLPTSTCLVGVSNRNWAVGYAASDVFQGPTAGILVHRNTTFDLNTITSLPFKSQWICAASDISPSLSISAVVCDISRTPQAGIALLTPVVKGRAKVTRLQLTPNGSSVGTLESLSSPGTFIDFVAPKGLLQPDKLNTSISYIGRPAPDLKSVQISAIP